MWERFSFYGVQGILLTYLYYSVADGGLGIDKTTASGNVGAYGSAVIVATKEWASKSGSGSPRSAGRSAWCSTHAVARASVFATMWTKLGDRQPSSVLKFALGTISIVVSFLLFIPMAGGGAHSAPLLGPVGLSLSTKLAPAKFRTQMVALFFLSVALGTAMSGLLTGYYDPQAETPYFLALGVAAIVVGAVLAALSKPLKRLMSGVR